MGDDLMTSSLKYTYGRQATTVSVKELIGELELYSLNFKSTAGLNKRVEAINLSGCTKIMFHKKFL